MARVLVLVGFVLIVIYGIANTLRANRRLDARIREFKAEIEAERAAGKAADPYAQLAELYQEEPKKQR